MLDTRLADRIRAKGVPVVETAGWMSRGRTYAAYTPRGAVNHHTAGARSGATPSLATVVYGRPGLPGPLAQVLQSREANGRDKAYVVAAGTANHAGSGGWRGLSGNASVGGLEIEHHGTSSVSTDRLETAARIIAALIEAPGSPRDARLVCQHFEWTARKIDFHSLSPWSAATFRSRVAYWVGRTTTTSPPARSWFDMFKDKDEFRREVRKVVREEIDHARTARPAKQYGRDWMRDNLPGILREELPAKGVLARTESDKTIWLLLPEGRRRVDPGAEYDLLRFFGHAQASEDGTPHVLADEQVGAYPVLNERAPSP